MEKITTAVESASSFVASHFDTVEKVTVAVTGVVLAGALAWSAKKAFAFASHCACHTYAAAKSRVSPPPDPVFARLLSHFDDPDAMYNPVVTVTKKNVAGTPYTETMRTLETGTLVVVMGDGDVTSAVKDDGYDVLPDLSDKERKILNARVKAKVAEVIERDRLARRANLSAPKAV